MPLPDYCAVCRSGRTVHHGVAELHVYVMQTAEGRLYVQYDAEQHEEKVRQFGYLPDRALVCSASR